MHRREVLAALGTTALAGCGSRSSDSSRTDGDPSKADAETPRETTSSPGTAGPLPSERPLTGVSLSPRSYESDDFRSFFEQAGEVGSLVRWAGDWADLGSEDGAAEVVTTVGRQYGMEPVIETGVFSVGDRALFRPLTPEAQQRYVETAAAFCEAHAPPYLGIGVEVDVHHETDPDSFSTFVDLFAETYDAVKAASPGTRVYTGFQLERLRGLRGGRFGGVNDPETASWDLLGRVPKADLVGLTTYPGLIYDDPQEIPDDYYADLAGWTDRPIAITETGWSVETKGEGWEADEAEQAAFVRRLFELVAPVDLDQLLWLWLYEQPDATGAFSGMGLRRADGSARPAWDAWVEEG